MFSNFLEDARKVLVLAKKEMIELKHPYIGSEHMLLGILSGNNTVSKRLKDFGVTYDIFKNELKNVIGIGSNKSDSFIYTPLLKRVINNATADSKENNNGNVTIEHLFSALLEEGEGVALRILLGLNVSLDKLYNEFLYKVVNIKNSKNKSSVIEELGIDLTNIVSDPLIGRKKELERLIEILSRRSKNNPLLVGEAGVGKTAIVEGLAYLIKNGMVPSNLQNKKIINIDMASLVAGTKYRGEFEERVRSLIDELEGSEDIILFIDEIHTIVGAGGAEGAIDASNIFKPALARGKIKVIGATTKEEYKKTIENDKALSRRFQNILVDVPTKEETKNILIGLKPIYESYHLVNVSEDIINLIVTYTDKYIHNRYNPDKSIDILDEVCAYTHLKQTKLEKEYLNLTKELKDKVSIKNNLIKKDKFKDALLIRKEEKNIMSRINEIELSIAKKKKKDVTKKDLANVLSIKTGIPLYEILNDNKKIIKNIKKEFDLNVLGQDNSIKECMDIIKKIKLGYKDDKCYSMMFVGPTGVGKTLLANLFSKALVGDNLIRIDASSYSDPSSIYKIFGHPGYMENKNILDEVSERPFSVILFDEIEKAHKDILNIFYQILTNGKIKNSKGEYVYFNNTVIIMTSNVLKNKSIGFIENNNSYLLTETFSQHFLNTIDNIIYFNDLKEEDVLKIIMSNIDKLKNKYKNKNINIKISNNAIKQVLNKSEYNIYGARKIEKIITDDIENMVISSIIDGNKNILIDSINSDVFIGNL